VEGDVPLENMLAFIDAAREQTGADRSLTAEAAGL
jgi:hypothetical protein